MLKSDVVAQNGLGKTILQKACNMDIEIIELMAELDGVLKQAQLDDAEEKRRERENR